MKKKIRAGLIHLLISIFLVSSVMAFVLLVCYPTPYFEATGVGQLLIVLATVDVCLGPLLTLIIFNPAKKWLKFELAFIVILQLSALLYGVATVFAGRPVYLVFDANGLFTLVSAYQIPEIELKKEHFPGLSTTGPKLVGAQIPMTREERKNYIAEAVKERVDLPRMLQYHVPYETLVKDVKTNMRPIAALLRHKSPGKVAETTQLLNDVASSSGLRLDELAFLPLTTRENILTVIVRRSDASIVKILLITPPLLSHDFH
ncbi:TfpX/TfpZ family type IV pilin accessory protein [Glaciimonas sp. GG7]